MYRIKIIVVAIIIFNTGRCFAQQSKKIDTIAVLITDRMSAVIGDLQSCAFKLTTMTDAATEHGIVKKFANHEVYLFGGGKMLINSQGYRGHVKYAYNGRQIAFYSYDENNYGILHTPRTTIETIDSLSLQYGLEFPAADFFYPAFTDDLLAAFDELRYLGINRIDGKEYFHIMATGNEMDVQFWIANDAYNLPWKLVITYKLQSGSPQYYASFSEWQVNRDLPVSIFDFVPPPGATKVRIVSKSER